MQVKVKYQIDRLNYDRQTYPFFYNVETIYDGFFNRHVYQSPNPPSTPALYHLVFLERLETEVEVKLDNPAASYFRLVA